MKGINTLISLGFGLALLSNTATASMAPEDATAYIISPANGEIVSETVTVKFGLRGMGVAPAGIDKKNTGHHHLLIDGTTLPELGEVMKRNVKHFGGGQTEAIIKLGKGKHTLQLILGNHKHIPHDPPVVSREIVVFVE